MSGTRVNHILDFLTKIRQANKEHTKKEAFKDLLNRLYNSSPEIIRIVDAISSGAEKTVVNIPRHNRFHRGSADTLYNRVIIEFENDLRSSLKHAKIQLAGYMLGQFHSGEGYNFTLIASDFINWKVFSPDISQIQNLENFSEETLILNETPTAAFSLTEANADEFFYWLDRFLFRDEIQKATLQRVEEAFGSHSNVFIESFRILSAHYECIRKFGDIQVSYEQWKKFLSIAYGTFDASEGNFLIHTYLSIFSKLLAWSVVSNNAFITDEEMKGIIDGAIFQKFNIRNFVENDFFFWIKSDRSFHALKSVFRLISKEISSFDFRNVDEDVLKGVYQELIDLDTRHALGEYYTPDWLCERIVTEYSFRESDKILDPACGSGSFIRAAIHRLKKLHPEKPVEQINDQIFGIDIHPLSVQIAKTTVLLALGQKISHSQKPVYLNIILANTLIAPEGVQSLFGNEFKLTIDKEDYLLNTQILEEIDFFDEGLDICDELAEQTKNRKAEDEKVFANILRKKFPNKGFNGNITSGFYNIYLGLKSVKEKGRDGIWKFILQNIYKPYFLQSKFDYVIGNPPWFQYSSVRNEEYQKTLNELAENYNVKPEKTANFPHLEIAAIFLAHCSNYFLKEDGRLAFVLPRSFFNGDQHENTRSGAAKGFRVTGVWDLEKTKPLFRIPSCVFFAEKQDGKRSLPVSGIDGKRFAGVVPSHNCRWEEAMEKLTEEPVTWFYSLLGKSSAITSSTGKIQTQENPYKRHFKQGATIVPRTFYFVELDQAKPPDFTDRILSVRTPKAILHEAKQPWNSVFRGKIESDFLFCTAISKNILPFCLYKPEFIILPVTIATDQQTGDLSIQVHTASELRSEGFLKASRWFDDKENIWNILRTEKNGKISSEKYLNWQNKLTGQNLNSRFLVLYNASAKDANATVVDRYLLNSHPDYKNIKFIVESKGYVYYTQNEKEAYYLAGILNSAIPNRMMKEFQSRGLFGARDVHKKILNIYFPKFDLTNDIHIKLAQLSMDVSHKVALFLSENPPIQELTGYHLGRLRIAIRKHIGTESEQIDSLVLHLL